MTTKTTKKPGARKRIPSVQLKQIRGYEKLDALRTELLKYINGCRSGLLKDMSSLNERLNDEVNKGHALYRLREQDAAAHNVLANQVETLQNEQNKAWGMLGEHRTALADVKTKIADISAIIPSFLRDTDALGRKVNTHDAQLEINFTDVRRTLGLHKQRLDKHEEQFDMYGHDIANLFGAHGDLPGVEKLIAEHGKSEGQRKEQVPMILRRARDLLQGYQCWCKGDGAVGKDGRPVEPTSKMARKWSAVGAISRLCSGELRHQVLLALCIAVDFVWHVMPEPPVVFVEEQMIDWLNEWNDGMVRDVGDVIFAFNLAIRRAERA